MDEIRIIGVDGIPEVQFGDNVAELIASALAASDVTLEAGDIVVVTHKIVSKAEGQVGRPEPGHPFRHWRGRSASAGTRIRARSRWCCEKRDASCACIRGLIIAETEHGFVCANAGVDASNVSAETRRSASRRSRRERGARFAMRSWQQSGLGPDGNLGVIISDSFGRPWRHRIVNVAIGVSGMAPLVDYRGRNRRGGLRALGLDPGRRR